MSIQLTEDQARLILLVDRAHIDCVVNHYDSQGALVEADEPYAITPDPRYIAVAKELEAYGWITLREAPSVDSTTAYFAGLTPVGRFRAVQIHASLWGQALRQTEGDDFYAHLCKFQLPDTSVDSDAP